MYLVKIEAVLNGWKVKVGCQEVVFTSADALCSELRSYLTNPEDVGKRYMTDSVNRKWTKGPQPETQDCAMQPPPAPQVGSQVQGLRERVESLKADR